MHTVYRISSPPLRGLAVNNVVTLVLGGGRGTRLYPLTKFRSKPAVPVAGKYRLIDIPLSNCINSGLNRIYVLTQFNSVSLHRHIRSTYNFDPFDRGFVEILAAQQTNDQSDWYQGTADAVRQNLRYFQQPDMRARADPLRRPALPHGFPRDDRLPREVGGRRDHRRRAGPQQARPRAWASCGWTIRAGWSASWRSRRREQELDLVRTDPAWIDAQGFASRGRDCLANMGIYLFNRKTLVRRAGKDQLPRLRQGGLPRVDPLPAACRSTFSTATGRTSARSSRSSRPTWHWRRPIRPFRCSSADAPIFSPAALPASQPHRRGHGPPQPDRRRLRDRRGGGRREQHRRAALPHRARTC